MSKAKNIQASKAIEGICEKLGFTRAHVASVMRRNAGSLGAEKETNRWVIPTSSVPRLAKLVRDGSGPRYKLGEHGPNRRGQ